MNIFITGGTGFIGSHLCTELLRDGHFLKLLTRNPEKYRESSAENQQFVSWNDDFKEVMEWADAVINLAGENIFGKRWTDKVKKRIYRSRVEGTRQLVQAMIDADDKPEVFISVSGVNYYGDTGGELTHEDAEPGDDFLARVCRDWENAAKKVPDEVRLVIFRMGIVLEKGDGALQQMIWPFKLFVGGPIGDGDQMMPWIHMADVCGAFKFMLEHEELDGIYNLCAPQPVSMRRLAEELGNQLNRPAWFRVPQLVLDVVLGEAATPVTADLHISSAKLQKAGYKFNFRLIDEALVDILNK